MKSRTPILLFNIEFFHFVLESGDWVVKVILKYKIW